MEQFYSFDFSNSAMSQENFRNKSGFDIENDDRLKNKAIYFSKLKFDKNKKKFSKKTNIYPKNKSDTLSLIKDAKNGIKIENFLSCYPSMKEDLMDLVKISGRHRKILIIKGKKDFQLTAFYFHPQSWLLVSEQTINLWHDPRNSIK
jgi:hypothetical protein